MTAENLTGEAASAIRRGWKVYRRASFLDWPREKALDIARALTDLHEPLFWYDRVLNSSDDDEDAPADGPDGLREEYAAQAAEAAERLTGLIRTACGQDLSATCD